MGIQDFTPSRCEFTDNGVGSARTLVAVETFCIALSKGGRSTGVHYVNVSYRETAMANSRRVAPSKVKVGKIVKLKAVTPGPVDDLEGFDEDNGGVITQVAVNDNKETKYDVLHDDLEFVEPGDDTPLVEAGLSPNISSMPRPQLQPQPTRRVVSQAEMQRAMKGGKTPANPVRSATPFQGSLINGIEHMDVDPKFCSIVFGRVRKTLEGNGVMNVRNHTKRDVHNAFLQTMGDPFESKEFFPDMVAQFCKIFNILRD